MKYSKGFDDCRIIEAHGLKDVVDFVARSASTSRFVLTDKGPLSKVLQTTAGDIIANGIDDQVWGIEVKVEQENRTGNFFLETWSNLSPGRIKAGWMKTLQSDLLFYYFMAQRDLFCIDFHKLQRWAFVPNDRGRARIHDFPERLQSRHDQLNRTYGACVPIEIVHAEVGFEYYSLDSAEAA
jgi:hypothetical protein